MSYTTIDELTKNGSGKIFHTGGIYEPGHTFFYAEDIKAVLRQTGAEEASVTQLGIISIKFEREDGENHGIKLVTGLALAKSPLERDESGKIINGEEMDWFDIVAIAWPPYYKGGTTDLIDNFPGSTAPGELFEGSDDYLVGEKITK